MQLPVDFKALIDEMTNIDAARDTELSVSVYIDEQAPADVVAHVRGVFASTLPSVRLTLSYIDNTFAPRSADDMAIIVAGSSLSIGAAAAALRAADVPVMVVTTMPATVDRISEQMGHRIPEGDIVAPISPNESVEPVALDETLEKELDDRMGRWIVSVCHDKRLALAIAFPFMRKPLAQDAVDATALQNAGIGLVPFIPGADLPIITLNQAKMVLQIAAAYGQSMDTERVKELIAVVGGAYLCRTLARELTEFIPALGFIWRTGIAYGGTAALGYAIIEYFEGGQNATGVANVATAAADAASKTVTAVRENPEEVVEGIRSKVQDTVPVVREKVEQLVPVAKDLAAEYAPKAKELAGEYAPKAKGAVSNVVSSIVPGLSAKLSGKSDSAA